MIREKTPKATKLEKILAGATMAGVVIGKGIEIAGYLKYNQNYVDYGHYGLIGGIVFGIITLATLPSG